MKKLLIGTGLIIILGLAAFISKLNLKTDKQENVPTTPTSSIVGGDKDIHGCIGSAGYTWCEDKKKCIRPWEEQCGSDEDEINKVVSDFYASYEECMVNPPAEAKGRVGEYCQENTGFSSSEFKQNLLNEGTAKKGADPIFCAQNIPESVSIAKDITVDSNKANAGVEEKFGVTSVKTNISLIKVSNIWKVDNISCPK